MSSLACANPHLASGEERYGAAIDAARTVVVLVHGRGQSPGYMREHVVDRLALPDVAFVAPAAAGGTWYPDSVVAPVERNEPFLSWSLERLHRVATGLADAGVPAERIAWCGFSQGACLVSTYVARHPRRWAGLVAFTGGLVGPPGTVWSIPGSFDGMPAYFSTSEVDEWGVPGRVAESVKVFRSAGAAVTLEVFADRAHEIADAEIDRARALLAGR